MGMGPTSPSGIISLGEYAQQAGLELGRHIADLVQEQGAAITGFNFTFFAGFQPASERACSVTEQLTFDQCFGNRCAVDGNKGIVLARAAVMKSFGPNLFTGTCFALDQNDNSAIYNPSAALSLPDQCRILACRLEQRLQLV